MSTDNKTCPADAPGHVGMSVSELEAENAKLREKLALLPADWTEDSSLETWFPITAQTVEGLTYRLRQKTLECERLQTAIGHATRQLEQSAGPFDNACGLLRDAISK